MANNLIPLQSVATHPRLDFNDVQARQLTLATLQRKDQADQMALEKQKREVQDQQKLRSVLSAGLPDDQTVMQLKMLGMHEAAIAYEKSIADRNESIAKMDKAQRDAHAAEIQQDSQLAGAILRAPPEQQAQIWASEHPDKPFPGPDFLKYAVNRGLNELNQVDIANKKEEAQRAATKAPFELQKSIADAQVAQQNAQQEQQITEGNQPIQPFQRATLAKQGEPRAINEVELAFRAAKGDKEAARALAMLRQGGGSNEPIVSIMGPDGKPVYVTRSQALGKQPASGREQGRAVTSGDANRIADFDTSLNDLKTLTATIPEGSTGTIAKIGASLPNAITNLIGWNEPKQKQAVIDRVKQVIGKALEGGVLRKEDEYKYEKILPTIYDNYQVAKTKLEGLQTAIKQRRETLIDSLDDAGYEVGKYRERAPGAGGASKAGIVIDPVGVEHQVSDVEAAIKLHPGTKRK